ncbi:serine phosphatase RsbU (regulator of sigma subunit) [Hamadaea flava]|uniref:PP2C family protein-serine/threonine phosphatase n=1 Tax=Hamadaea flava TaxID=1742688 RepID=A0ABV8LN42_9ACTN|nr:PP2C family protein-serine/threonine phosphatase [Hamadaea flava]MCP2323241.1 serine phosphatase RsbU (regulator of sigma subunit) [Hamadaea flava]
MTDTFQPAAREHRSLRRQLARHRRISHVLQDAIQPTPDLITDLGGLRIAVRCRAGDPQVHIGGDWYLVTQLPDGDVVLAVGDVEGHGLPAVESMIGLRYAMAAYASAGEPPAVVLTKLNNLLCQAAGSVTATAVIAKYRPSGGRLVWARAGHPPVLLSDHRRGVRLPNPRGPLLGMFAQPPYEQEVRVLRPGQSLVLYTDGMIGRGSFDDGISQLADRIAGIHHPAALLDQLDFSAAAGDDACVLVAQRTE